MKTFEKRIEALKWALNIIENTRTKTTYDIEMKEQARKSIEASITKYQMDQDLYYNEGQYILDNTLNKCFK